MDRPNGFPSVEIHSVITREKSKNPEPLTRKWGPEHGGPDAATK